MHWLEIDALDSFTRFKRFYCNSHSLEQEILAQDLVDIQEIESRENEHSTVEQAGEIEPHNVEQAANVINDPFDEQDINQEGLGG